MCPLPIQGSIKTLCLIQRKKPSPVYKYRKRLDFAGLSRYLPSVEAQHLFYCQCFYPHRMVPEVIPTGPEKVKLKSMLKLKGLLVLLLEAINAKTRIHKVVWNFSATGRANITFLIGNHAISTQRIIIIICVFRCISHNLSALTTVH